MSRIYHITTRTAWQDAERNGEYRPSSLAHEGFIHFSQRHQILEVAHAFYRGQNGLVLLSVETEHLKAELRYEPPLHPAGSDLPPVSSSLFPHLYGPLNLSAVLAVVDLPPDENGLFSLPPSLP
ncbi:MAG: DUF952 domain-containing protein [Anaerolineales bacterium]|nr:DUF952 domain-containing protein [Anaerolineales bacterium]